MAARIHTQVKAEHDNGKPQLDISELRAAQRIFSQDHKQGWKALDQLFRSGIPPEPMLNGRYAGELIAIDIAPGLTQFFQWLTDKWMPWLGKTFNAAQQSGDNIFTQDSYPLARLFNPFYRSFVVEGTGTYRCFTFNTYFRNVTEAQPTRRASSSWVRPISRRRVLTT